MNSGARENIIAGPYPPVFCICLEVETPTGLLRCVLYFVLDDSLSEDGRFRLLRKLSHIAAQLMNGSCVINCKLDTC